MRKGGEVGMRIITGPRGSGITTRLIEVSARTGYTIIVPTHWMVDVVKRLANEKRMKIPEPIAITQLTTYGGRRCVLDGRHRVLIDELDGCLQMLGLDVVAATMCAEEAANMIQEREARLLSLKEYRAIAERPLEERVPVWLEWRGGSGRWTIPERAYQGYGVNWRCWTGKPSEKEREAQDGHDRD